MVDLVTERMELRLLTAERAGEYAELMVELDGDPEVMRFITGEPTPQADIVDRELPTLLARLTTYPRHGRWFAFGREDGAFLGWFELAPTVPEDRAGEQPRADEAEVGYRLLRSVWGRGYATEGTRALIAHAFDDVGLRRVWAQTMAVNLASRGVMERVGMIHLRTFHVHFDDPLPGTEQGEVEYELLRSMGTGP